MMHLRRLSRLRECVRLVDEQDDGPARCEAQRLEGDPKALRAAARTMLFSRFPKLQEFVA
jgi:hypothetical protein